jgi:hypothetical protein
MTAIPPTTTQTHSRHRCLDVLVAADYLGICPRTLDNWRSQLRGPRFIRVGRLIRYRLEDLQSYLDAHTVETDHTRAGSRRPDGTETRFLRESKDDSGHPDSSTYGRYDEPVATLLRRRDELLGEIETLGGAWSEALSSKIDLIQAALDTFGYSDALGRIPGREDDQ